MLPVNISPKHKDFMQKFDTTQNQAIQETEDVISFSKSIFRRGESPRLLSVLLALSRKP